MTIESLKENKAMISCMDDNLAIHLSDYLTNPTIVEKHNFNSELLIKALKNSTKYVYDPSNDIIRLQYRPKRRLIVFRDVPKSHQNVEELKKIFEKMNHADKIQKVELVNELFFVYFETEEHTIEAFKCLEKMKETNSIDFSFNAMVKVENLKKEWLHVEYENDVPYISNIILDPKHFMPRKISVMDSEIVDTSAGKRKTSISKFDKYDPNLNFDKRYSGVKNKFDIQVPQNTNINTNMNMKRNKAYSISENYSMINKFANVPLNKDYELRNTDSLKADNVYSIKDITRVFLNMNMMKKFDQPEEFKKNFLKEVMKDRMKINLDHFKEKHGKIETRERANTYYGEYKRRSSNNI
jgi:hypothetical protein